MDMLAHRPPQNDMLTGFMHSSIVMTSCLLWTSQGPIGSPVRHSNCLVSPLWLLHSKWIVSWTYRFCSILFRQVSQYPEGRRHMLRVRHRQWFQRGQMYRLQRFDWLTGSHSKGLKGGQRVLVSWVTICPSTSAQVYSTQYSPGSWNISPIYEIGKSRAWVWKKYFIIF